MGRERFLPILILIGLTGALAPAYAADEIVIRTFHLDKVRDPKSGPETIKECLNNSLCETALSAAAVWMGVPPNAVKIASGVGKIVPLGNKANDETKFDWWAPDGYQSCRLSIDVISTVPAGPDGSLLDVSFEQRKSHVVTYVPVQSFGQGRAWVEAMMVATYVKDGSADARRADGTCKPLGQGNPPPWVYRCRGTDGDGQGREACGSLRY